MNYHKYRYRASEEFFWNLEKFSQFVLLLPREIVFSTGKSAGCQLFEICNSPTLYYKMTTINGSQLHFYVDVPGIRKSIYPAKSICKLKFFIRNSSNPPLKYL